MKKHDTAADTPEGQRRHWLKSATAAAALLWLPSWAQQGQGGAEGGKAPRLGRTVQPGQALREMQIHQVDAIGLEVWVENQPPWQARVAKSGGRSVFAVNTPENYHPPAAMTYATWPEHKVAPAQFRGVAYSALQHASQNFGLSPGKARVLDIEGAQHGVLAGHEVQFVGKVDGTAADVRIFIGMQPGRALVVITAYTVQGKMGHLQEAIRRGWGNVSYL